MRDDSAAAWAFRAGASESVVIQFEDLMESALERINCRSTTCDCRQIVKDAQEILERHRKTVKPLYYRKETPDAELPQH